VTDGQTDRILIARPRLHFMQRGKNDDEMWNKTKQTEIRKNTASAVTIGCLRLREIVANITSITAGSNSQSTSNAPPNRHVFISTRAYRNDALISHVTLMIPSQQHFHLIAPYYAHVDTVVYLDPPARKLRYLRVFFNPMICWHFARHVMHKSKIVLTDRPT